MHSDESKVSPATTKPLATDFVLPVFDQPQLEPWPLKMSWAEAMRHFAAARTHHMRYFDSPERRLPDKNPERFQLD